MSRFFSVNHRHLVPYTPGEQPKEQVYIKLNTNESPFSPSPKAIALAAEAAKCLQLYPDPDCSQLVQKLAQTLHVDTNQLLLTNGSDEILNFAFMAFCDAQHPAAFPDITYGFYSVFAEINHVPYTEIPLKPDFTVDISDYEGLRKTIFIANPNAPTGILLPPEEIEKILKSNPDHVVIVDEAYIDFGGESCIPLIEKYDNLLVTQTFSKSRSMAGARLGFGVGCAELIRDLNTIKYSTNPYNINRMTMAAGLGVLEDDLYTTENCRIICENREFTKNALTQLGFNMTDSAANFVFAKHPDMDGEEIYLKLKEKGVLVRHFNKPRIQAYNRITIGTRTEMERLIGAMQDILEGK